MQSRRIAAIVAVCTLLGACGRTESASTHSALDADVVEYVRLAVALGARDGDSLDYAYPPAEWVADDIRTPPALAAIRARATAAAERVERIADSPASDRARRRSLAAQLRALAARADLLSGKRLSFHDESRLLFGITPPALEEGAGRRASSDIEHLVPGPGSVIERYESFARRQLVPTDRVPVVFERALAACRQQTRREIALPANEAVEVVYVHDSPWNGYSRYHGHYGSTIQVNLDYGSSVDDLLVLACHEGYPGHHVQNVITEEQLVVKQHLIELTVQPAFSHQSLVSEALAVHAIDRAFPGDMRAALERDVLYPAAGLDSADAARSVAIARAIDRTRPVVADIVRRYLDGDLEFARALPVLRDRALVPQPAALLKFVNRFRSYALTYTYGPDWLHARDPRGDDARDALLATLLLRSQRHD